MAQTPPPTPGEPDAGLGRRSFLGLSVAGAGAIAFGTTVAAPAAAAPPPAAGAGPLAPGRLTTEYAGELLGTDVRKPRLTWTATAPGHGATQSAYQVLVATSPDRLAPGVADVWDSGRVASPQAVGVAYAGPALAARSRYH